MEIKEQEEEMRKLVSALTRFRRRISPLDFQVMFVAILSNTVGQIADDDWRRMMHVKSCSRPGCNCHEVAKVIIDALNVLRNDHIDTMSQRSSHN